MEQYLPREEVIFSAKSDTEREFDFSLPEYLPGISRIVRTSACAEKCTASSEGSDVRLDLSVKFSVIYISDFGGKIKNAVFHESFPISFSGAPDAASPSFILPSCSISFCKSKPISPRKIHTRLSVISGIRIVKPSQNAVYAKDGIDSIHIMTKPLILSKKTALYGKDGEFDADVTLDAVTPAVNELIFCDAVFCKASSKCGDGVLDYEADFTLHAMYETAGESSAETGGVSSYFTVSIPYTAKGSIYDESITPSANSHIRLDVSAVDSSVSFDSFGENKVISFNVKYSVSGILHSDFETEIATDGFSDKYECEYTKSVLTADAARTPVNSVVSVTEKVRADTSALSRLSDCFARILSVSYENSSGKYFAAAKCALEFIGTNAAGEFCALDANAVLHVPLGNVAFTDDGIYPDVILSIGSAGCMIKEGEIICDFNVYADGYFFEKVSCGVLEDFKEQTDKPLSKNDGTVVVYYPSKGDILWDIAKKYKVSPEVLKEINGIDGDGTISKKTLLIP